MTGLSLEEPPFKEHFLCFSFSTTSMTSWKYKLQLFRDDLRLNSLLPSHENLQNCDHSSGKFPILRVTVIYDLWEKPLKVLCTVDP